jgi:hypothetical protein
MTATGQPKAKIYRKAIGVHIVCGTITFALTALIFLLFDDGELFRSCSGG